MKNWNNFINEEYRNEIPPKYMEKIIEFINSILKENGLSWNEYLEIEEYVDGLFRDDLGDGGVNLHINTVSYNSFLTAPDFKAKDLAHAKRFIKKEMIRNIALSKQRDEADEESKEFDIIINELTDLYKLYPEDKKSLQSYSHDEIITITITPKNMKDLLEISKIYHYIGYAVSRQTFFRVLNHGRASKYEEDTINYNKLTFMLGSVRSYPIETSKSKRKSKNSKSAW
jgi:hypothetical protein